MFKALAAVFMGVGAFFHGMFGGHGSSSEGQRPEKRDDSHFEEGSSTRPWMNGTSTENHRENGVLIGVVSAINGSSITIEAKQPRPMQRMEQKEDRQNRHSSSTPKMNIDMGAMATTTYTIDASHAKIFKGALTASSTPVSISSVLVGDKVIVRGKITNTSMVADVIIDGLIIPRLEDMKGMLKGMIEKKLGQNDEHQGGEHDQRQPEARRPKLEMMMQAGAQGNVGGFDSERQAPREQDGGDNR